MKFSSDAFCLGKDTFFEIEPKFLYEIEIDNTVENKNQKYPTSQLIHPSTFKTSIHKRITAYISHQKIRTL